MADVVFQGVTKEFPGGVRALEDLDIAVADGEFMIFVGPSGCGKTTALRLVAGLDKPTSGLVAIGKRVVNELSPKERDIAMVFQNYALYPHMSVRRNLAFALKERRVPKAEIQRRVEEVSGMLGLGELLDRKPAQLSGGQRQRVAMGRALVREPAAFLLDEPLSNLDAKLRVQVRGDLKRLHQQLGITTIYVTHDQVEAMTLGERIAVMSAGCLQQVGPPQEVYDRPANLFVAAFIGSPPMNLLRAVARAGVLVAGDLQLPVSGIPDGEMVLGLRPERLRPAGEDGHAELQLQIEVVEPLGDEVIVHGTVRGELARVDIAGDEEELLPPLPGARAEVVARLDPRMRPRAGDSLRLAVPDDAVHVFDAHTGRSVR
ncbi:MAG: ABC transporter ATP-binding protein [Actinomycetota bacterium]